jgi:hypothetical protein
LEYSDQTAEMLGRLNEFGNFNYSSSGPGSENMDLWNNAVGRKTEENRQWENAYRNRWSYDKIVRSTQAWNPSRHQAKSLQETLVSSSKISRQDLPLHLVKTSKIAAAA